MDLDHLLKLVLAAREDETNYAALERYVDDVACLKTTQENQTLRAALKEALDGWDANARALVDDPHHSDEKRIADLRKDFNL